jgi:hypothetical protein
LESTSRSFAPGVVEKLVDDLVSIRVDLGDGTSVEVEGEFVEPVQLQAVCQRLWSDLPSNVTEITHEHLRPSATSTRCSASCTPRGCVPPWSVPASARLGFAAGSRRR